MNDHPLQPGDALGLYTIVDTIYDGPLSWIYEVVEPNSQVHYAAKVLKPTSTPDEQRVLEANFTAEYHLLSGIFSHCEDFVDVRAHFEDRQTRVIVMELLEGETLEKLVDREGALSPEAALRVIFQVARSIKWMHDQGIIWCDLKPANIFLTKNQVKILDLASIFNIQGKTPIDDRGYEYHGYGTPGFAAPEMYTLNRVTYASDVYALGALLAYMLTGRMPELAFPYAATALKKLHHGLALCIKSWTKQDPVERPIAQICLDDLTVLAQAGPLHNPPSSQPVTQLVGPAQPRSPGLGPRSQGLLFGQLLTGILMFLFLMSSLGLMVFISGIGGWSRKHNIYGDPIQSTNSMEINQSGRHGEAELEVNEELRRARAILAEVGKAHLEAKHLSLLHYHLYTHNLIQLQMELGSVTHIVYRIVDETFGWQDANRRWLANRIYERYSRTIQAWRDGTKRRIALVNLQTRVHRFNLRLYEKDSLLRILAHGIPATDEADRLNLVNRRRKHFLAIINAGLGFPDATRGYLVYWLKTLPAIPAELPEPGANLNQMRGKITQFAKVAFVFKPTDFELKQCKMVWDGELALKDALGYKADINEQVNVKNQQAFILAGFELSDEDRYYFLRLFFQEEMATIGQ